MNTSPRPKNRVKKFLLFWRTLVLVFGAALFYVWVTGDRHAALELRGLPYGSFPRQTLDLFIPHGEKGQTLIVFFYGGRWKSGERSSYAYVGRALASRGYTVAIPDYRLYPDVVFPEFLEDSARAVGWAKWFSYLYGGATEHVVLMGHSAGAYNAMMLGLDSSYMNELDSDLRTDIAGVVGISGPYDFRPFITEGGSDLRGIFGSSPSGLTQPVMFVRRDAPPLLLLHGILDPVVWVRNAESLAEKTELAGGKVFLKKYPLFEHLAPISGFFRPLDKIFPVVSDVDAFIRSEVQ